MNAYPEKQHYTADDLAAIIAILRDPDNGCPWDKVQTHRSIRMNFLEEAYEAVDAIDLDDPELLCEELGDVLMQVVFHAQIEREAGHFTFAEVCDGVCRKLLDRHPHIFRGDESIKDWDSLKNKEKGRLTLADDLESVPGALPALMRAAKLQSAQPAAAWKQQPHLRTSPPQPRPPSPLRTRPWRSRQWESCCLPLPRWRARRVLTPSRRCRSAMPRSLQSIQAARKTRRAKK